MVRKQGNQFVQLISNWLRDILIVVLHFNSIQFNSTWMCDWMHLINKLKFTNILRQIYNWEPFISNIIYLFIALFSFYFLFFTYRFYKTADYTNSLEICILNLPNKSIFAEATFKCMIYVGNSIHYRKCCRKWSDKFLPSIVWDRELSYIVLIISKKKRKKRNNERYFLLFYLAVHFCLPNDDFYMELYGFNSSRHIGAWPASFRFFSLLKSWPEYWIYSIAFICLCSFLFSFSAFHAYLSLHLCPSPFLSFCLFFCRISIDTWNWRHVVNSQFHTQLKKSIHKLSMQKYSPINFIAIFFVCFNFHSLKFEWIDWQKSILQLTKVTCTPHFKIEYIEFFVCNWYDNIRCQFECKQCILQREIGQIYIEYTSVPKWTHCSIREMRWWI